MSRTIENPYENFIALSRYARWLQEENRRETWGETVDRYFDFMLSHLSKMNYVPEEKLVKELKEAVYNRSVMPSMRSVMTAARVRFRPYEGRLRKCGGDCRHRCVINMPFSEALTGH